jgi:hypothetical protein
MAFDMQEFLKSLGGAVPGLAQAGGGLFGLFNKPKNPADSANKYISQIPGQTQQYYQPYMDAGKGALSNLQNQYGDLLSGTTQNKLGESYKESPGYQFALKQALQGGNNAAAMGGNLGMPQHEQANMEYAQGLAAQDYDKYIQNQMGLYGQGLQGNQLLNQQGFDANKGMADTVGNALSQQGAYAYGGQAGMNQAKQKSWSDLFGGLGDAGASMLGGSSLQQLLKYLQGKGGNA